MIASAKKVMIVWSRRGDPFSSSCGVSR